MGGNPACDSPGAVEIATRWAEYNGCVGELKLGDKPKYDLNTAVDGKETPVNKFQQCPNGIDVELWTVEGVPHPPRFYEVFGANGIKTLAQKSWEFLQAGVREEASTPSTRTGRWTA